MLVPLLPFNMSHYHTVSKTLEAQLDLSQKNGQSLNKDALPREWSRGMTSEAYFILLPQRICPNIEYPSLVCPIPMVYDSLCYFFFYQDGQFGYSPYFVFQSRNCFVGPFFGRGLKCILEEILDAHLVHGTGARFSDRDFSWYLKDSMIHILGILWKTISNCGWYCFELINLNPWRILKWFRL